MEMFCCEITEKLTAYESAPVKNQKSVYSILSHELCLSSHLSYLIFLSFRFLFAGASTWRNKQAAQKQGFA